MSIRQQGLTQRLIQSDLNRVRQMQARGIKVEIAEWLDSEPLIVRVGDEDDALVFDTYGGSAAYAIWIELVARHSIILSGCQIESAFDDQIVCQLH